MRISRSRAIGSRQVVRVLLDACFLVLLTGAPAMAAQAPSQAGDPIQDGFKLFVVGDVIEAIPIASTIERLSPSLIGLLKSADVGYGNFEGTAIDWQRYHGAPQAQSGGDWLISTPAVPADLKSLGFDLVGRANNHGTDWGVAGMLLTDRLLDEAGVVHAGSGVSESAARAPAFFNSAKGRVALVSVASSFVAMSRPADRREVIPARPGVSVLDTRETVFLPPARLAELRNVRDMLLHATGMPLPKEKARVAFTGDTSFGFAADPKLSSRVRIHYAMDPTDLEAILLAIRQAKETAGLVIVALHAHQPSNYSDVPPDFVPVFAHDCIDAGADVIAVSGPHRLRGIEIYEGRPIFYSLGNFVFQLVAMQPEPVDEFRATKLNPATATDFEALQKMRHKHFNAPIWYDSVLPIISYSGGRAREIKLYPLQLGFEDSAIQFGVPRLADPASGSRILARLARLSASLGTIIQTRDGAGVIDLRHDPVGRSYSSGHFAGMPRAQAGNDSSARARSLAVVLPYTVRRVSPCTLEDSMSASMMKGPPGGTFMPGDVGPICKVSSADWGPTSRSLGR